MAGLGYGQGVFPEAIRQRDVMVAARDGVELATDVHRPATGGVPTAEKLPVLLHRTPYDKNAADAVKIAEYFVPPRVCGDDSGYPQAAWVEGRVFQILRV